MKRIAAVFLLFAVLLCLPLNACAASSPFVVDDAGLLTSSQVQELNALADRISSEYRMDVVVLTVNSLGGKSAQAFADDYYDSHDYRYDGLILVLAIQERDWYISTSGTAIEAFTDYGLEQIEDIIVPHFSSGDFYQGFYTFLNESRKYMQSYAQGEPIDVPGRSFGSILLVSAFIGLVCACVSVGIMCGNMNTKRRQFDAGEYVKSGSFSLPVRQDIFLYSNVTKTRRPENNSSGKGGSSVHTSSSGRSHGGRGGKF